MTAWRYEYKPQPIDSTTSPIVATITQQTICRNWTCDVRAKNQRKSAVAVPRANCCGRPSRSSRSRTVMKTAEAVTKVTKRDSIGEFRAVYGLIDETDSGWSPLLVGNPLRGSRRILFKENLP